jgi:hypothetical protein
MLRYDHTARPTSREVADACLEAAEKGEGETLRAWCRRHAWPEVGGKPGPWSGRELQDAGVATRIDATSSNATLGFGGGSSLSTQPLGGGANPTIIAVDDARATEIVEQAVQAAVRSMSQAQPTVVVAAPERRRRSPIRALQRAVMLLAATTVVLGALIAFTRPDDFGAIVQGDWGALGLSLPSLDSVGADEGGPSTDVITAESWLWGATTADPVATVELHFSSGDAVIGRDGQVPVTAGATATAHVPPGPVEVRPAAGGDPLVRELAAGDTLRVRCADGSCTAL